MTLNITQHNINTVSVFAECRKLAHYAECRYTECRYTECRYTECHYTECH